MKSNKEFRATAHVQDPGDNQRKAVKLSPIKKSGKDRHSLYSSLEEDDDLDLEDYRPRESVLDYFDDQTDNEEDY